MADSTVFLPGAGPVPVIDFGLFLDGTKKQAVADAIVKSFKDIGFVYLVNHGMPADKVDNMFEWVGGQVFLVWEPAHIIVCILVQAFLRATCGSETARTAPAVGVASQR